MKHIYLFVSSTFEDMADERELLVREVFPEVEKYRHRFQIEFSYMLKLCSSCYLAIYTMK